MSSAGWRITAGIPTVLLATALALATPASAEDQKGSEEKPDQATTAQGAQAADQAAQTPAQQPTLGNAQPVRRNSLAAAAARIHLHRPQQEGGAGGVVITNDNLGEVAAGGNVSVAGGTASSGAATSADAGTTEGDQSDVNPASVLVSQYLEQKRTVEGLEVWLKNFDEQLAKPPVDPHYSQSQNSPQFRAPGVVDPAQKQRDDVAKQLAEERAKLEALRARARHEGVELDSSK